MTDALLQALRRLANYRGQVIIREAKLLGELGCTAADLRTALAKLEARHVLRILAPLPYLILALAPGSWSGRKPKPAKTTAETGRRVDRAYSFQSSLSQSKQLMKESYRQPSDEEALLKEILQTLGETDPTTFRGAIRSYPPGVIRTALTRVRRMKTIRKNPTALFRFLLPRVAKESHPAN